MANNRIGGRYESSGMQLAEDIDLVYPFLKENNDLILSSSELAHIKDLVVSDKYNILPLRVHYVNNKHDLDDLLLDNLMEYHDVEMKKCPIYSNSTIFRVVTPTNKEDALVLRALSVTLLRLLHGCLPKESFQLEDLVSPFYDRIQQIERANRIYKIDLGTSITTIPLHLVDEKIQSLVGDSSVYKLISPFFHLPIIIDDCEIEGKGFMSTRGIPAVGEITKVLLHLTLRETFDREFTKRFPGIPFSGFHDEVFIFTTGNEKVLFDEKALFSLLEELSLSGTIVSMGPGDKPLPCYSNKLLFLDSYSQVILCDSRDFYSIPNSDLFLDNSDSFLDISDFS